MRSRAAIPVLTLLLIASSQGCAIDGSRDGPPFEPEDIQSPESLLITNSDIEGAGARSPYGVVLRWWQALQLGDVERVKQSYARPISSGQARRQIEGFRPRFSQPIDPTVRTKGELASLELRVRTARPLADTPGVVSVRDFTTHFYLVKSPHGWKLRLDSYRNYSRGRARSTLAVR